MYKRQKGDDLLSKDTRLKYKWRWCRTASQFSSKELKKWTHFQSSLCEVGDWRCEATQWGSGESVSYEARIEYIGDSICNIKGVFKTRIEAQIAAEKLLIDWITREYKFISAYTLTGEDSE